MSFEEFIKYIREREQRKLDELVNEKNKVSEEYEQVLNQFRNLKEPFFKKVNPILYFIVGGGIALIIGVLCVVFARSYPKITSGTFVIPSSILAAIFGYGGYWLYNNYKHEKGQPTKSYLEYDCEKNELHAQLVKLREFLKVYNIRIRDFDFVVKDSDIELAKECYLYLIDSERKKKKINIDEKTLDKLLENSSLAAIVYEYFHDELDQYRKLSGYERLSCDLGIRRKISKVKESLEKELKQQEQTKELENNQEKEKLQKLDKVPYQRVRRTVRNRDNYNDNLIDVNEEEKGHRK